MEWWHIALGVLAVVVLYGVVRGGGKAQEPTAFGTAAPDDGSVDSALSSGQKIEAIRRYREQHGVGLKEAREAVEAVERGEAVPGPAQVAPTSVDPELRDLIGAGRKIAAIKRYRELHGVGLKEAKEAVEAIQATL